MVAFRLRWTGSANLSRDCSVHTAFGLLAATGKEGEGLTIALYLS